MSARLLRRTELGIAPRLGIAFGAVAILAVAANAISEHGASLLSTVEQTESVSTPAAPEATGTDALAAALDHFQQAAVARAGSNSAATESAHQQATTALTRAGNSYAEQLRPTLDEAALDKLAAQARAYRQRAADLVKAADRRRQVASQFNDTFTALDARLKASMDRTWKLFGKVIARQYLIDANAVVNAMRPLAASFGAPGGYRVATLQEMAAQERALAAILGENERGIDRTMGENWLAETRGELESLSSLRALLVSLDRRLEILREELVKSHSTLAAEIRRTTARFEGARAVASARRQSVEALTAISAREHRQRTVLAWLSGCVLLLLLAISVNTIISVVRPVRRLLEATRRIAEGESGVTVPRGGIRELDRLAVAFNYMAQQLAAAQEMARQYHGQLEAKVEERTRQLQHLAEHDPLTRLPNRRQLFTELNAALERAAHAESRVGVFFLDFDHFKTINDSMGHVFGDRVLQTIAERLRGTVADFGFSARLGGDEFTVVYERATGAEEIEAAGRTLVRAFQAPLMVDGRELLMGLSVGASMYPEHGQDAETLLRAADAALFRAKEQGRSQLSMFSPELLESAASRFATEQGLRRAVERHEFELFFQPEVRQATLQTGLAEALLRWRLPGGAHASPADFLRVAEDCGLIREIGEWVVGAAIAQVAVWQEGGWPGVRVAVNVSSLQLLDNQFVDGVLDALGRHGVAPSRIEIELTENVLQTGPHTIEALRRLRAAGVGVALDDFGTGYSSLASLEQLPLSRVKLDRSLIASIDTSARSQAIARAIISLCQSLRLDITAEGIERPEQLAWLGSFPGVDLQGHLLSRPVAADKLLGVIADIPDRIRPLTPAAPAPTVATGRRSARTLRAVR